MFPFGFERKDPIKGTETLSPRRAGKDISGFERKDPIKGTETNVLRGCQGLLLFERKDPIKGTETSRASSTVTKYPDLKGRTPLRGRKRDPG